jgi:hypothetical protein
MYLEDGVEENNLFDYNLVAHIHFIAEHSAAKPYGSADGEFFAQQLHNIKQTNTLLLPADVTASGFYITNAYNEFVGNAVSGAWAGYSFPTLPTPLNGHRYVTMSPSARPTKTFNGNTAHSIGYWWQNSGGVYVGGSLHHPNHHNNDLVYNGGRTFDGGSHSAPMLFTNTKVGQSAVGILHWGSIVQIDGAEFADFRVSARLFGQAWMTGVVSTCQTANAYSIDDVVEPRGDFDNKRMNNNMHQIIGFQWYDTDQQHIVQDIVWRECGGAAVRSIWSILSHSDEFTPEAMQVSSKIVYEPWPGSSKVVSHFTRDDLPIGGSHAESAAARQQNWLDADGTASGRDGIPTLLGASVGSDWWKLDSECEKKEDWALWACNASAIQRVGSIQFHHNPKLHADIGQYGSFCGNTNGNPCPAIGWANHLGSLGQPIALTANPELTGPLGGLGWRIALNEGSPRRFLIKHIQVPHTSKLIISLPYPPGTAFSVSALPNDWCETYSTCRRHFTNVDSVAKVRGSDEGAYHFDGTHLYLRIIQQDVDFHGKLGTWGVPDLSLRAFKSKLGDLEVPYINNQQRIIVEASCHPNPANQLYCAETPTTQPTTLSFCPAGTVPSGYGHCANTATGVLSLPPSTQPESSDVAPRLAWHADIECVAKYNQCGGVNDIGSTDRCCGSSVAEGTDRFSCVTTNKYYHQCQKQNCLTEGAICGGKKKVGGGSCCSGQRGVGEALICVEDNPFYSICKPKRTHEIEGAALNRPGGNWALIKQGCGCEQNTEGITRFSWEIMPSIIACQDLCMTKVGCVAVDFLSGSGYCNMFAASCTEPTYCQDAAWGSYAYIDPAFTTTTAPPPSTTPPPTEAPRFWYTMKVGCCRTAELGGGEFTEFVASSLNHCQDACDKVDACLGYEYTGYSNECELHTAPTPLVELGEYCMPLLCYSKVFAAQTSPLTPILLPTTAATPAPTPTSTPSPSLSPSPVPTPAPTQRAVVSTATTDAPSFDLAAATPVPTPASVTPSPTPAPSPVPTPLPTPVSSTPTPTPAPTFTSTTSTTSISSTSTSTSSRTGTTLTTTATLTTATPHTIASITTAATTTTHRTVLHVVETDQNVPLVPTKDPTVAELEIIYKLSCNKLTVDECVLLQANRPYNKHKSRKKYCKINKKKTKCLGRLNGKFNKGKK